MLHPKDFIHPEDEAALRNLEAIPGFSMVSKVLLKYYDEKMEHGIAMASRIRLSPTQLPHLYNLLPPLCKRLSIAEPELYLEMNPAPNAFAFGDTKTMITLTSGLIEYLNEDELRSVIAHECGHIACRHMLYRSLVIRILDSGFVSSIVGKAMFPVVVALFYWSRKSELSADRAAAIAIGDIKKIVECEIRLAGGPKGITKDVNIPEFVAQADYYDNLRKDTWDNILQIKSLLTMSHPYAAVRVREILKWGDTEQYRRMVKSIEDVESSATCPSCRQFIDENWVFCKHCGTKLK